jgi:GntR family transcriptional regulator, regulator for abcA and norABC
MEKPDRTNKKPLYEQIFDNIVRSIVLGEYPPGSYLPSERKLAENLDVNRSTVIKAYEELRARGIVERMTGSGTMVSKQSWGMAPSLTPNWRQFVEGGVFAPNLPLIRRVREVLQTRESMINFASGELSADLFPNEATKQIMQTSPFQAHLGYDEPFGYSPLRETLVTFLQKNLEIQTTEASILITSGSQQSLFLLTQCLLAPGDAVAVEAPSYCYSLSIFQSAGLRVFGLPVHEDGMDPEDIRRLFRQHRIRMIFLNPNYQNPTGSILHSTKRQELLQICAELGIPIVEDDPFSLTSFHGEPPPTLKSIDSHGTVLYVGSLSKIAASGLRIGWMVAPQSVMKRLADARQQMDFGLSVVPQWLTNEFLRLGYFDEHIQLVRAALSRKHDLMAAALQNELGDLVSFRRVQGGLNIWCKIHGNIDDHKLLEESVKRGVVMMPGAVYGAEPGHVRLSFARPLEGEILPGVQKLAEAIRALL